MSSSPLAGSRTVRVATLLSIGLAFLLFFSGYQSLIYDAWSFAELARRLSQGGFVAAAYDWRTYGYPLFVALCSGLQTLDPATVRVLVFLVQLAVYLGACAAGARVLAAVFRSAALGRTVYVATALNPFLLARATETLSDLLSAVLVYLGVLLCLPRQRQQPEDTPERVTRQAAASLFCLALATMVRPSNLAVLAAVAVLWLVRQAIWRDLPLASVPLVIAAAILPFFPQTYVNLRAFGKFQPLVVRSLYRGQTQWGMAGLKYGTLLRSGEPPQLHYGNPLYRSEPDPVSFLRQRPLAYTATLGLHLFAMLDHDFVLTYSTIAHPWYRWPLSIVNYAFLFLCLAGAVRFLPRLAREGLRDPETFAGCALLFTAAASVVLYLPTLVESRFSAPAMLLLTPFLAQAIARLRNLRDGGNPRRLAAWAIAGLLFLASCAGLSAWVAAQAPRLAAHPSIGPPAS